MRWLTAIGFVIAICTSIGEARSADGSPLMLERKMPLGDVRGRIDHLAIDLGRKRLFVAELGNGSVGVVDLAGGKLIHRIGGLKEPQGVGYVPSTDTLYVANAGDGLVRLFRDENYTPSGQIALGQDADNIRVDLATNLVLIGHGAGALAVIDPMTRKTVADIPLKAHPEGFQVGEDMNQIFVNMPSTRSIVVIDRASGQERANWATKDASGNFPMALDHAGRRVLVVFRNPAKLVAFDMKQGGRVAEQETCGDSDDVFVDVKRKRVYVTCGDGFLDVFTTEEAAFRRLARIPTASGARTSLFIPALDRLALAVRATPTDPAAIWIYRPTP